MTLCDEGEVLSVFKTFSFLIFSNNNIFLKIL
ncbi:hypothetical protein O1Q79_01032 [Lonepinella sp. MS14434]